MSAKAGGSVKPYIESVEPPAAIGGGEFEIRGRGFTVNGEQQPVARFGSVGARLVVGGSTRIVVRVPEDATEGRLVLANGAQETDPYPLSVGLAIAENLHPVANPAVDDEGNIYTTRSGTRGEKFPVSVFKIDTNFTVKPLLSDIVNPTGLVFSREGTLYVSGRDNGTIYSLTRGGKMEVYAEGMGVATGLAIDDDDNIYVGDRTGTVFKISPDRQIFVFATLEPSISAYHLAFGPGRDLYVTGPTTSSFDCISIITPAGDVKELVRGFGRPQGMIFDSDDNLYVAGSYGGRKGVFRVTPSRAVKCVVSGPGIVGLALLPSGEMVVATSSTIFRLDTKGWMPKPSP